VWAAIEYLWQPMPEGLLWRPDSVKTLLDPAPARLKAGATEDKTGCDTDEVIAPISFTFDRLNMILHSTVKSVNLLRPTPISGTVFTRRGSIRGAALR
jgi:hypothetical protein